MHAFKQGQTFMGAWLTRIRLSIGYPIPSLIRGRRCPHGIYIFERFRYSLFFENAFL